MGGWSAWIGKRVAEMGFKPGGAAINWFPGHMASATRAIRGRLKLADLVIEVRDARIPLSSANEDLQEVMSRKRRVIAFNKKDLANPNIMQHWVRHFESGNQDCLSINAHSKSSVNQIANQPSIYVLDTPGVLVPSIPDLETGLKLALTGAVKDSVVGEERLAQYLLAILNIRETPLHWERLSKPQAPEPAIDPKRSSGNPVREPVPNRRRPNASDVYYIEDLVKDVKRMLYTSFTEFDGNLEEENELETLIDNQLTMLRSAFRIPHKASGSDEARLMVSKKLLTLFRTGKLGAFILDNLPASTEIKS